MLDLPFHLRVLALAGVLLVIALVELAIRGRAARRWVEYLVLLALAALGAVFGAANDSLTVRLSPDYFALGKGLGYGPGLDVEAATLGAEAGFSAGAILACGYLWAASVGRVAPEPLDVRGIFRNALLALLLAVGCGVLLGLAFRGLSGLGVIALEIEGLSRRETTAFTTVWRVHIGLYLGALLGAVVGIRRILARRGVSLRAQAALAIDRARAAWRRDRRGGG